MHVWIVLGEIRLLLTSDRQVVDANGCQDALERVARDVTERAQRQMIRNHYENEKRGAREEARQEVIQVILPHFTTFMHHRPAPFPFSCNLALCSLSLPVTFSPLLCAFP